MRVGFQRLGPISSHTEDVAAAGVHERMVGGQGAGFCKRIQRARYVSFLQEGMTQAHQVGEGGVLGQYVRAQAQGLDQLAEQGNEHLPLHGAAFKAQGPQMFGQVRKAIQGGDQLFGRHTGFGGYQR